ncbi:MAG: DUF4157 domain-containing protein [Myxococcota bacterium]
MAADDDKPSGDVEAIDESLQVLAGDEGPERDEEREALEELAQRVEEPGLQDRILERYQSYGRELLSDTVPSHLDPRITSRLEPLLGDVGHVRVHRGATASKAARAMEARAFAIGDEDIFVDAGEFDPQSPEGAALLAHEVAHTRDAATGFAMSSRRGPTDTERERFADEIAMVFAEEEDEAEAPRMAEEPDRPGARPDKPRAKAGVDKKRLEERVHEILAERGKRERERNGL